jgi:enamine deaminase RidA (YjgF/YER057c/UK114 family)
VSNQRPRCRLAPAAEVGRTRVTLPTGPGAAEARLLAAGIDLPLAPKPAGSYRAARIVDGWLFTSGQLSWRSGAILFPGLLGREVSIEQGREAVAVAARNLLAHVKAACGGDLDRVAACVRLTCFLACTPDFHHHPAVLEPASEILAIAFGPDAGAHARLAYGASALPFNSPVEIEGVFRLG